jgi:hypothetical protein
MSKREWREAEELGERGRWEEAGARWAAIVEKARRVRETATVRDAAVRAADAYRRDDRPAAAAKMLTLAREAGRDDATDAAQLSAVLLDAGEVTAAADIAEAALARAADDPVKETIALDTLLGMRLTQGRVDDARGLLDRLAALGLPGAEMSRRFRVAQVDRLDGLVARAEAGWEVLAAELGRYPAAAGPEGATWAELGEIDLLRAAFAESPAALCARAAERFERAGACWAKAGRRAGAFRAEAWAARARAVAGETVLPASIDRAITYADERGMPLLAADLLACRAVVTRTPDDLLHAIDRLAEAPLARGRARVLRAELGGAADLDAALGELASDGPWTARALRAVGRARGDARLLEEADERARGWG